MTNHVNVLFLRGTSARLPCRSTRTCRQVKQLVVPRVVLCVQDGVADPNIAHRKRSSFFIIDEGETEEGDKVFG